jgi:hypothetical protein
VLDRIGNLWAPRPEPPKVEVPKQKSTCALVWIDIGGRLWPQRWFIEPDGGVVGMQRDLKTSRPTKEPVARHDLSIDEANLTLDQLAERYPAPKAAS